MVTGQPGGIGPWSSQCDGSIYLPVYRFILTSSSTIKVLIIIALLFDTTTGVSSVPCKGWPLDMPLACTKKLWSAKSELLWNSEYTRYLTSLGGQSNPNYHDLLCLEYGSEADKQSNLLEVLLQNLDEFGMMAITTTKYFSDTRLLYSGSRILE